MPGTAALIELAKPRITIASTFTTALGYLLVKEANWWGLLWVLPGILLLAGGSASLNHVQDAAVDARMGRTAARPIPSGRISRQVALAFSALLLGLGSAILGLAFGAEVALVGLCAALLYNAVYTPLKRVTPFAVFPGALIGGVPPLVGWLASGGDAWAPGIHQICFFFFVWQIPHFWLLLLFHQEHYRRGGLPTLFDRFDATQIGRLTFVWITATAVSGIAMPLFRFVEHGWTGLLIAVAAFAIIWRALALLHEVTRENAGLYRVRFMEINGYALWVVVVLLLDRV